jgi:hypothetical protein
MSTTGGDMPAGAWIVLAAVPVLGFGIPGVREVVLVLLVALALYGRAGSRLLLSTRTGRSLGPWARLLRTAFTPAPAARPGPRRGPVADGKSLPRPRGRLFWALALTAAAAVAAWVATRAVIHSAGGSPH